MRGVTVARLTNIIQAPWGLWHCGTAENLKPLQATLHSNSEIRHGRALVEEPSMASRQRGCPNLLPHPEALAKTGVIHLRI